MTTLLLTRHGQSEWNAEGRWQGQADPPLSDFGRHQAAMASQRVGTVDIIISSPQDRALTTAAIIGEQIGVGPIIVIEDLRERHAGSWSGLTTAEINEKHPGWLDAGRRPDDFEAEGPLQARVTAALDAIAADYAGAYALVMCHGGVIKAFEEANGVTDLRVPNLGGRVITAAGGTWRLGERIHLLDDELSTGGQTPRV